MLHSGMKTLQSLLGCKQLPTRVVDTNPLPDKFLMEYFSSGYDEKRVLKKFGKVFEDAVIRKTVNASIEQQRNKGRNERILNTSLQDLVEDGVVSVENIPRVEQAKTLLDKKELENQLNPDLEGEYPMTFSHWITPENEESPIKSNLYPNVEFILKGYPDKESTGQENNNHKKKKKHYYIYSEKPGFGKSHAFSEFCDRFNGIMVRDIKNWADVPHNTQFLIFEEVGHNHNKLDFELLKTLTAGTAKAFAGNCKTFGDSYSPRPDVQVIMLSNLCPYNVYGTYDPRVQRRFIDAYKQRQFTDRFFIHKLDGPLKNDVRKFTEPSRWTDQQFQMEIQLVFEPLVLRGIIKTITMTSGKIEGVVHYVNRAKELLKVKYLCAEPDRINVEVFADLLERCCQTKTAYGLHLTWQELVLGLFRSTLEMKKGVVLKLAMDDLVKMEELKPRMLIPQNKQVIQSIKAEKLINYPELHAISDMIYTAGVIGVDKVVARKRAWDALGACFIETDFFGSMNLMQVTNYMAEKPKAMKHLLRICYKNCSHDMSKCMKIHSVDPTELRDFEDIFRITIFEPMQYLIKNNKDRVDDNDLWTDSDDDDNGDAVSPHKRKKYTHTI